MAAFLPAFIVNLLFSIANGVVRSMQSYLVGKLAVESNARSQIEIIKSAIQMMQDAFSVLEKLPCLVVACIEEACIGSAMELALACDICYCTEDAFFCVKETELGIVADLGLLQRGLKKLTKNNGLFIEACYTSQPFSAAAAFEMGLVAKIFGSKEAMLKHVHNLDLRNKSKSVLAEVKRQFIYARDNTIESALLYAKNGNAELMHKNKLLSNL